MIVNPDNFHAIGHNKNKSSLTNKLLVMDNKKIKSFTLVELLGTQLDDKLNFNCHIKNIC